MKRERLALANKSDVDAQPSVVCRARSTSASFVDIRDAPHVRFWVKLQTMPLVIQEVIRRARRIEEIESSDDMSN